jgi:hypothetical protein
MVDVVRTLATSPDLSLHVSVMEVNSLLAIPAAQALV